ncbi:hypothetical protein DYD21_19835 [Rhodohalobacter sp. SW132]|uniref:carboxypeptidase regulatory-like domain-containing protein n=1 Tax=Rhodohalobacter sp. SW132 TaxID=2293433 RepID=UPI000E2459F6|nr:carboxypeptidase regulatory-like domain-containing protein [Rhodohalobacter sp. SW132]REL24063.1 hypothetical protein DYD21_19835 [Rhodohalobacter sp. SW132]
MLNKTILPLATIFLMFFAVACGSSGMVGSDDQTAVAGVVLDSESYDRIANATVTLTGEDKSTVTNENGVFTFVDVGVGTHDVTVESDSHGTVETTIDVEQGGSRVEIKL